MDGAGCVGTKGRRTGAASASPVQNKPQHPPILPLLCLSGWATKLKQEKKKKDSKIEGINLTAFICLHKCLHVN